MPTDTVRPPRPSSHILAVHAPDPAFGVGRALRSAYKSAGQSLPFDMQQLLDQLD